jgi:AcrR family transcriptional regulator
MTTDLARKIELDSERQFAAGVAMAKRRLRTAERREQIATAALEIIATRGAGGLTAAELAKAVGTSDAALFRHFEDKAAIVTEAIAVFERTLMQGFPPEDPDPLERLRLMFVRRVTLCRAHPHVLKLAFDDRLLDAADAAGKRRVRRAVKRSVSFIHACVSEAQQRGLIAHVDPVVVVWMFTGVVRGAVALATDRPRTKTPDAEALWSEVRKVLVGGAGS